MMHEKVKKLELQLVTTLGLHSLTVVFFNVFHSYKTYFCEF